MSVDRPGNSIQKQDSNELAHSNVHYRTVMDSLHAAYQRTFSDHSNLELDHLLLLTVLATRFNELGMQRNGNTSLICSIETRCSI